MTTTEPLKALKAAAHSMEFFGNDKPMCPHCGEAYDIGHNDAWQLYDDNDSHDVTCLGCELDFRVVSHSRWTFSTDEQGD